MKNTKAERDLLPPDIILSAIEGDEQAVMEVIDYYDRLIHAKFVYASRKRGVNISYMPLADMKQEVRLVLIKAIQKFNT